MGLRILAIFGIIFGLSYYWGQSISEQSFWIIASLCLVVVLIYQSWNQHRLVRLLLRDDLIGRKRGIGIWNEIYALLDKRAKAWRQEILQSEVEYDRFIQAIQASPNGLIMLDEEDQIEWCNKVCKDHFRLDPFRDARQKVSFLIRHPDFVSYLHQGNFSMPLELDYMGQLGNLMLLVQIYPYGENRKLVLSQDITILKKNESMRQDFVANVSHELRTPLTVLNGFLETIKELNPDKQSRERFIEMMLMQSTRMLTLVEELLILTRLDNSPISEKTNVIVFKALIDRLLDDAKGLSKGRHQFKVHITSQKNILGSDSEIFSAFGNLINNAVRYTPEKGIITIEWIDMPNGGAHFIVQDTGIGIAKEHIPRITERFYRVDRSRSRDTGGTGLGLAIVKHVASRHDALLEIDSEYGFGSSFSIQFPKDRLTN